MAQPSARARIMADIYFRTYTTADGWLAIACGSTKLRAAFSLAIGLEDRYSGDDPNNHEQHYERLRTSAEEIMLSHPTAHWEAVLAEAGVPASRVLLPFELLDDPQVEANSMLYDLEHPVSGSIRVLAPPVVLDETGFQPPGVTAPFASETRALLAELGFDDEQVDGFIDSGVTRDTMPD